MTKLKYLAEQHLYNGKKLTVNEYTQLKNSKYSRLINSNKVISKFDTILEQLLPSVDEVAAIKKPVHRSKFSFYTGLEKGIIRELIDEIEEAFHLDISSSAYQRYSSADFEGIKNYIENYTVNTLMGKRTANFLQGVAQKESIHELMHALFLAA